MKKQILIPATVAAVVALAGVGGAAIANSGDHDDDEAREIAAVMAASVSLTQAIARSEAHTNGWAIKAGAEDDDGDVFYEVMTVAGGKVLKLLIDPETGLVLSQNEAGLLDRIDDDLYASDHDGLSHLRMTLSGAVAMAEQTIGGRAVEADLEDDDGVAVYEVEVTTPGGVRTVLVDGSRGEVLRTEAFDDD